MSGKSVRPFVFLVFSLILALSVQAAEKNSYIIKARKIYTVSQGIVDNGTIVVEKGKIVQVGKDISVGSVPEAVFIDGRPVYARKEGAHLGKSL